MGSCCNKFDLLKVASKKQKGAEVANWKVKTAQPDAGLGAATYYAVV